MAPRGRWPWHRWRIIPLAIAPCWRLPIAQPMLAVVSDPASTGVWSSLFLERYMA